MTDKAKERKGTPVASGVLFYFPNAMKEIARCSQAGNDQHHSHLPLHWDMSKSSDEPDALVRHLIDHHLNPRDDDGMLHLTKVAWRALAMLERYLCKAELRPTTREGLNAYIIREIQNEEEQQPY